MVLLDRAVAPLASGLSSIGVTLDLRVGPADRDVSDATFVAVTATATKKALAPYAPVRARAVASAAGIQIGFVRRGRVDADAWEPMEIPLGEDAEKYTIEIARPSGGPRVLTATTPAILYATADIVADFGAPPGALDLTIRQVSAAVGPGFPLVAHVSVQ